MVLATRLLKFYGLSMKFKAKLYCMCHSMCTASCGCVRVCVHMCACVSSLGGMLVIPYGG